MDNSKWTIDEAIRCLTSKSRRSGCEYLFRFDDQQVQNLIDWLLLLKNYYTGGKMNNWISVKDKLPDTYTEVIVYYPPENLYIQGYFEDITNSWHEIGGNKLNISPTHWMPLPKPPTQHKGE